LKKLVLAIMLIPVLLFQSVNVSAENQGQNVSATEKIEETWQGETMYYIMIDRFNNGNAKNDFSVDINDPQSYYGGDFQGVTMQLDYIKDMGFTSIILSPIFDNEDKGYHGYWIKDFKKPEEQFGTLADFRKLVKEAHKRDLKIIVEFPANSVGPNHPWLTDPAKKDWFHENKQEKTIEKEWVEGLPDLNHDNQEVKAYLIDAAKWWVKETNIDGYKLDRANYVPTHFWNDFSNELKKIKPELFLLADVAASTAEEINAYSKTGVNGLFDYPESELLRNAFAKPDQSTAGLFKQLETNKKVYESPYLLGTFMDNQRSERFTHSAVVNNLHPGTRWKLALTYLYSTPGIPVVFYGSEIALEGVEGDDNRKQMDFRTDQELIEYMTKIGELRSKLPSLTKGTFEPLYNENGMMVFKREFEGEQTVIAINNTSKSQNIKIDADKLQENNELRGLINDDLVKEKNGEYSLIIDRDLAEIYLLSPKSGFNFKLIAAVSVVYIVFASFLFLLIKRGRKNKQK
jgi:glycosidase